MENTSSNQKKTVRIRCPECSNYFTANENEKNVVNGKCPICKVIILSRQHSPNEKLIKILKQKN